MTPSVTTVVTHAAEDGCEEILIVQPEQFWKLSGRMRMATSFHSERTEKKINRSRALLGSEKTADVFPGLLFNTCCLRNRLFRKKSLYTLTEIAKHLPASYNRWQFKRQRTSVCDSSDFVKVYENLRWSSQ